MVYIGGRWSDYESMLKEWRASQYNYETHQYEESTPLKEPLPTEAEILFASYGGGSYEGDAVVIFRKGEKLYEVRGSHCSCYGLEGQWDPEETSVEALAMRDKKAEDKYYHFLSDHDDPAYDEYWKLIEQLTNSKRDGG